MKKWQIKNYQEFLTDILDFSEDELITAIINKKSSYKKTEIQKSDGRSNRSIYCLKETDIAIAQRNLMKNFFFNINYPSNVFGYKKGCNYFDFLNYHKTVGENTYFLRIDINEFFDSVKIKYFEEAINYYISDECSQEDKNKIIENFIGVTTFNKRFVQGAITSPAISNLVFRPLDIRIERYCFKMNIKYSRYADDLLFSSESPFLHSDRFIKTIGCILSDRDFTINSKKTLKQVGVLNINGYIVGETVGISRRKLKNLNHVLFIVEKEKSKATKTSWNAPNFKLLNYLCGYRSYLIQLQRYGDSHQREKIKRTIHRIETVIDKYY